MYRIFSTDSKQLVNSISKWVLIFNEKKEKKEKKLLLLNLYW